LAKGECRSVIRAPTGEGKGSERSLFTKERSREQFLAKGQQNDRFYVLLHVGALQGVDLAAVVVVDLVAAAVVVLCVVVAAVVAVGVVVVGLVAAVVVVAGVVPIV